MKKSIYIISGSIYTPIEHIPKTFARNTGEIEVIIKDYFEEKDSKLISLEKDELTQKIYCSYLDDDGQEETTEFIYTEFNPLPKK